MSWLCRLGLHRWKTIRPRGIYVRGQERCTRCGRVVVR